MTNGQGALNVKVVGMKRVPSKGVLLSEDAAKEGLGREETGGDSAEGVHDGKDGSNGVQNGVHRATEAEGEEELLAGFLPPEPEAKCPEHLQVRQEGPNLLGTYRMGSSNVEVLQFTLAGSYSFIGTPMLTPLSSCICCPLPRSASSATWTPG